MAERTAPKRTNACVQKATEGFAARKVSTHSVHTMGCENDQSCFIVFHVEAGGTCGDILLAVTGKIIYSGALSGRTSSGNCSWRVSTDPMRRIALGAVSFDSTAFDCQTSYVAVYDGNSNNAPLIGTFCKLRPFETIFSSDRHIYIEYAAPKAEMELHYVTFYTGMFDIFYKF